MHLRYLLHFIQHLNQLESQCPKARQNLNADHNLDLPPEMILSPRQKSIDKVSSKVSPTM